MHIPRIILSGTSSWAGKTVVSIGLMRALRNRGLDVRPFKVGPDFIDPSYHHYATGRYSRNLDAFMMTPQDILCTFQRSAEGGDIAVIEGTMGLYDSYHPIDEKGSTAHVSKILKSPVILIANVERIARTAAPLVLGYKVFDKDVDIEGVILNRLGNPRHAMKAKLAVENLAKMRVIGVLPKDERVFIPERHLGLIPAYERKKLNKLFDDLAEVVESYIDVDAIIKIAEQAKSMRKVKQNPIFAPNKSINVRLGFIRDEVFTFYYQDNIDAFAANGAEIIYINSIKDRRLPDIDALYIGGGYPEIFARELEVNVSLKNDIYEFCDSGKPTYAECGGLMYLGESLTTKEEEEYKMVGFLPIKTKMLKRFQALGYVKNKAFRDSPIAKKGAQIIGHEFHYSKIEFLSNIRYVYKVERGKGVDGLHDGLLLKNTLANYMHVHVLSYPEMVKNFLSTAKEVMQC
jgi:cobyrinic acid a,c-diamide synthase